MAFFPETAYQRSPSFMERFNAQELKKRQAEFERERTFTWICFQDGLSRRSRTIATIKLPLPHKFKSHHTTRIQITIQILPIIRRLQMLNWPRLQLHVQPPTRVPRLHIPQQTFRLHLLHRRLCRVCFQ